MTQIPTDEGKGTGSGFESEPGTRLAGDVDGDGDVDFADVTAALALKLPFEEVTRVLAGMQPAPDGRGQRWCVPVEPPREIGRDLVIWSRSEAARVVTRECEPVPGVVVEGRAITSRLRPPVASDPARRWLLVSGCTIAGDGGAWNLISAAEWGGGVWFEGCRFEGITMPPASAAAYQNCVFTDIGVDVFHHTRAVRACHVQGLRKPAGSDAHPDLWQQSWPAGTAPGPLVVMGLTATGVCAQPFFARSAVKLPAILLSRISVELTPDCAYVSQLMRELGDVRIENVSIRRAGATRPIQIRNDPATGGAGIAPTRLDSLVVIDSDVVIDPSIVIGG